MRSSLNFQTAHRATVTDLGRYGLTDYGIPANGAADQYAARCANILVGNPDGAALIEITSTELVFTTTAPIMFCVSGAPAAVHVDGMHSPQWAPVVAAASATISIAPVGVGVFTYVAIRGALHAETFRGSYAPDPLLGVGTRITAGTELQLDNSLAPFEHAYLPLFSFSPYVPDYQDNWILDVLEGPEWCQFGDSSAVLTRDTFTVSNRSNQVGTRLQGERPMRDVDSEILSRGVPLGAIEVPPAGELLILQRGRPVTAGYPVIAVVTRACRDALGQLRPGDSVRLRLTTPADARTEYTLQQQRLDDLRRCVSNAFDSNGLSTTSDLVTP